MRVGETDVREASRFILMAVRGVIAVDQFRIDAELWSYDFELLRLDIWVILKLCAVGSRLCRVFASIVYMIKLLSPIPIVGCDPLLSLYGVDLRKEAWYIIGVELDLIRVQLWRLWRVAGSCLYQLQRMLERHLACQVIESDHLPRFSCRVNCTFSSSTVQSRQRTDEQVARQVIFNLRLARWAGELVHQ